MCLTAHPEAALRLDVQHGEDGLVQHGVAHRLCAVSVGRHLGDKQRRRFCQLQLLGVATRWRSG